MVASAKRAPMSHGISAVVFDAYGTLFDVHSVTRLADTLFPGKGAALSAAWRTKQLEYTWLQSLMAGGVADRRRSRRLWGLGLEAQVQLGTAMRQLLVALDQADADDPEAHEAIADGRLLLARAIGDIQAVLGELADLSDQLRAR